MNNPFQKTAQNELVKYLDKLFFFSNGSNDYTEELFLSALGNTYVETVDGRSDSLHLKIRQCNWENFLDVYQETIKSYIKRLKIKRAILAFDTTSEPFYGKTTNMYTIGCEPINGYSNEYKYLVVSIINDNKEEKIPITCIPITYGFDYYKALKIMLEYSNKLFKIKLVLLDRGFYSVDVVRALRNYKYIMLVPKLNEQIKYYNNIIIKQAHFYHKIKNEEITRIVLVRDKSDKFTWSFATNIIYNKYYDYVNYYKKRWRIETNFRVEDEAKIKTKSIHQIIRYFYFTTSLLLHSI